MYVQTAVLTTKQTLTIQCNYIIKGKHRVYLSREVTCNVRQGGRVSTPIKSIGNCRSNCRCLYTRVPYNTAIDWDM